MTVNTQFPSGIEPSACLTKLGGSTVLPPSLMRFRHGP